MKIKNNLFNIYSKAPPTKKLIIIISIIVVVCLVIFLPIYFLVIKSSTSTLSKTIDQDHPLKKSLVHSQALAPSGTCQAITPWSTKPITPLPQIPTININGKWSGWSTTTCYSGDINWPGTGSVASIDFGKIATMGGKITTGTTVGRIRVNNETIDVIGSMGAAIPWSAFKSLFGWTSRLQMLTDVINSCNGTNSKACCLIVQPISKYPAQIIGQDAQDSTAFPMLQNISAQCTNFKGAQCNIDINSDIVASHDNGKKFPAYFIVPNEGCGGNCAAPDADCYNSCSDIFGIVENMFYYQNCKNNEDPNNPKPIIPDGPNCELIKQLSGNNYIMTLEIEKAYAAKNNPYFAISEKTQYGWDINAGLIPPVKDDGGRNVNYCSGKNMHLDIAFNTDGTNGMNIAPLWAYQYGYNPDCNNSITLPTYGLNVPVQTLDMGNTIVRYMLVPGNIFGNFDIRQDGSPMPTMPIPTNVCVAGAGHCGMSYDDPALCSNPVCIKNDAKNCPAITGATPNITQLQNCFPCTQTQPTYGTECPLITKCSVGDKCIATPCAKVKQSVTDEQCNNCGLSDQNQKSWPCDGYTETVNFCQKKP